MEYYNLECCMQYKSGEWMWFFEWGKVIDYNEKGELVLMVGIYMDINDKKCIEIVFVEKVSFQQLMFDYLLVYLFVKDIDYCIVMVNE